MKILRRDNLTHAFFFDEINGTTLTDKSGGGRNATVVNSPTIQSATIGRGLELNPLASTGNGTQYSSCPDILNPNGELTVMFGCTPYFAAALPLQKFGIISKRDTGEGYLIASGYTYPAQLVPLIFTQTPAFRETNLVFFEVNKSVRGVVCSGSNNVSIYKNGELHDSYAVTGAIRSAADTLRIGSGYDGRAGSNMSGLLDYLLIWNVKLSSQEVAIMDRRLSLKRGMNI